MTHVKPLMLTFVILPLLAVVLYPEMGAQAPNQAPVASAGEPPRAAPTPNNTLVSPEVSPDRHVTFRIYAPNAQSVAANSEIGQVLPFLAPTKMTKAENGVWSLTVGPVEPGVYGYDFLVDGIETVDPRNSNVTNTLTNVHSIVTVPGADFQDVKDVPHGAVSTIWYYSGVLSKIRRMHIYTPPGYEANQQRYPVLYLLPTTNTDDDTWTSQGYAGFILDNLIAASKAKPMIIVMPNGAIGKGFPPATMRGVDLFNDEFVKDIIPYTEKNYRVIADRDHRAIAGSAIGGLQALNISLMHLDQFSYVGVMSSGWDDEQFVKAYAADVDNTAWRKDLKLVYVAVGKQDTMSYQHAHNVLDILKAHGYAPEYYESSNGHTWISWRDYLVKFASRLFQ